MPGNRRRDITGLSRSIIAILLTTVIQAVLFEPALVAKEPVDRKATLDYLFEAATAIETREAWPRGRLRGTRKHREMFANGGIYQDVSIEFSIDWDATRSFRELRVEDLVELSKKNPALENIRPEALGWRILRNPEGFTKAYGPYSDGKPLIQWGSTGDKVDPPRPDSDDLAAPFENVLLYAGQLPVSAFIDAYRKRDFLATLDAMSEVVEQGSTIVLRLMSVKDGMILQEMTFDKSLDGRLIRYAEQPGLPQPQLKSGTMEWARDQHGFLYLKSHHYKIYKNDSSRAVTEEARYDVIEYDSAPQFGDRTFSTDRLEIPPGTRVVRQTSDPNTRNTTILWGKEDQNYGDQVMDDIVGRLKTRGFTAARRDAAK